MAQRRHTMYALVSSIIISFGLFALKNDDDKAASDKVWKAIGTYMQAKYDADKNLSQRTAFKWTIVRPGWLSNDPGTGNVTIGKVHLRGTVSVSTAHKVTHSPCYTDD